MGDVLEMKIETVTVKQEKADQETDDRTVAEEYFDDNIQSADSNIDPMFIVKIEIKEETTSDQMQMSSVATQKTPEDTFSSKLEENNLAKVKVEDFKGNNNITTNEPTSALSDDNTEQYICDVCQECFTCYYSFESHIRLCSNMYKKVSSPRSTDDADSRVNICNKEFKRKDHYIKHKCRLIGDRPYKCVLCQKCFKQKTHLDEHICAHAGERPYHCNICYKVFLRKETLNIHICTHTGAKLYKCTICNRILQKSTLSQHTRTHTTLKPYQCKACDKCFSVKRYLDRHVLRHTNEKPYQCNVCNKRFALNEYLKKHSCKRAKILNAKTFAERSHSQTPPSEIS